MEKPTQEVVDDFKKFYDATNFPEAQQSFSKVLEKLKIEPDAFPDFFPKLKRVLQPCLSYIHTSIWDVLENKSKSKVYGNCIATKHCVLVVGAGPCGLRTAIETQFLGAKTILVESRQDFTRNNVLKLWKFLIEDLKSLGMKNFFPQFCNGDINHISIKKLQLVLAKICLMLGIKIITPVRFKDISYPTASKKGWRATFAPDTKELNEYMFDMLIIASGKKMPIDQFNRQSLNAKLAIAVTGNFVNHGTKEEQEVKEISGLSKQYNLDFFNSIKKDKGISLENIVYYKGDTHYFVMTATRESLLDQGVLKSNAGGDRMLLFDPKNIDKKNLYKYVIEAAEYSTNYLSKKLSVNQKDFAKDHSGNPDVAVFDFTNLYSAKNACHLKEERGCKLIMAAVGDSLLEPFWPEGTGCARGFLSALNAAWMLRRLAEEKNVSDIVTEREELYRVLKQTSDDVNGDILKDDHAKYTIDPTSRYKNAPRIFEPKENRYSSRIFENDSIVDDAKEVQIRKSQKEEENRLDVVSFTDRLSVFGQRGTNFKRPDKRKRHSESTETADKSKIKTQPKKKLSVSPTTIQNGQQRRPSPKSYRAPQPPTKVKVEKSKDKTVIEPPAVMNGTSENAANGAIKRYSGKNKGEEKQIDNDEVANELPEKTSKKKHSNMKRFNFIKKLKRKKKLGKTKNMDTEKDIAISLSESSANEKYQPKIGPKQKDKGTRPDAKSGNGSLQPPEFRNNSKRQTVADQVNFFHDLEKNAGNMQVTKDPESDVLDAHPPNHRDNSKCVIL